MEDEDVTIDFDIPTDLELVELAATCLFEDEEDDDETAPF